MHVAAEHAVIHLSIPPPCQLKRFLTVLTGRAREQTPALISASLRVWCFLLLAFRTTVRACRHTHARCKLRMSRIRWCRAMSYHIPSLFWGWSRRFFDESVFNDRTPPGPATISLSIIAGSVLSPASPSMHSAQCTVHARGHAMSHRTSCLPLPWARRPGPRDSFVAGARSIYICSPSVI